MGLSEDDAKFPFEINDGNYDRTFERVSPGETVAAQYSMAIREDSYTGYYPIKFTITFRLSSEGDLHTEEGVFYVHVVSKDKEDDLGEFDANDRVRARVIVEGYHTVPEEVYAGNEFELVLNMKMPLLRFRPRISCLIWNRKRFPTALFLPQSPVRPLWLWILWLRARPQRSGLNSQPRQVWISAPMALR